MQPAADQLANLLLNVTFNAPKVTVINNVDVATPSDPDAIKKALIEQLYSPVRWTETVTKLADLEVTALLEIGPSKVLTGLTRRIDKRLSWTAINTLESIHSLV